MENAKILIVEDEKIVARDIENRLKSFGYAVAAVVSTGEAAIKKAAETLPDLVLMDILLKGDMDGVRAAEQIRTRFNIPVIYLTAYADDKTLQRAKITEPFGYIIKPFEERELRTTIEIALYRHKMERKMQESEKRYKDLFDSTVDGVYRVDARSVFVLANQACAELFGHQSPGDLIGRSDREYWVDSQERDAFKAELKTRRSVSAYPIRARRTDGTTIYLETSSHVVEDSSGITIGVEGIFRNVTERRLMEKALKDSEKKYRTLVDNALIGIYKTDLNGDFLYVNETLSGMFEYDSPEDMMSHNVLETYKHKDDRKVLIENLKKTGRIENFEVELVTKTGNPKNFILAATLEGDILSGMIMDVTERKRAEEMVVRERDFSDEALNSLPSIFYLFDQTGKFLRWNNNFERVSEYSPEEIGRMSPLDLFVGPDKVLIEGRIREVFDKGFSDAEAQFVSKSGKQTPYYLTGQTIQVEKKTCLIGMGIDITERKKIEEQIFRISHDWEDTFDSITDMITVHDKDFNIVHANKAAEKILGLPFLEKTPDAKCFRYYHGSEKPPEGCPSCGCLQTGVAATFELFEPHLNMFIEIRAIPRFDSNNQLIGLIHVVRDITERKRSEEALRESEEKFRNLFENAIDGIFILDLEGNFIDVNRTAYERLGYTKDEMLSMSVKEIDTPEFASRVPERLAQIHKHGHAMFESAHHRKDGTIVPVEVNSRILSYRGQKVYFSVIRDITERKQAEEALRNSEQRLLLALDAAHMGTFDWDVTRSRITWSRWHEELWGFAPGEFDGTYEAFEQRVHPDDLPGISAEVARCSATRERFSREFRVVWPDGSVHWIVGTGEFEFSADGQTMRMRGTVVETTARRLAEDALREKEYLLSESQYIANIGSWSVDIETGEILWTEETYRLFGVSRESRITSLESFYGLIHADDRAAMREWVRTCLAKEHPGDLEFRVVLPDGAVRILNGRGDVECNAENKPVRIVGTVQDITDRKEVEEKLNLLFEEVSKAKTEWEMTFDSVAEIIVLVDKELTVIRCNKSCADFCGRPVNTIPGHKFYDLFPWSSEDLEYYKEKIQKEEPTEWIETKTTTGRWFYLSHRPIADRKGDFLYSVIIATDITGLKSAQEKIQESEEALKERVKELEKFYEMAVGRELKMKELKKEIAKLEEELSHCKKGGG
jgi:PAS domain S-box-containing protein